MFLIYAAVGAAIYAAIVAVVIVEDMRQRKNERRKR